MTSVTITKELFEELIDTKIKSLTNRINEILTRWHYSSIDQFLRDAADGTVEEAESDAISLQNLFEKRESYFHLRFVEKK
jgi:hypothetical protein